MDIRYTSRRRVSKRACAKLQRGPSTTITTAPHAQPFHHAKVSVSLMPETSHVEGSDAPEDERAAVAGAVGDDRSLWERHQNSRAASSACGTAGRQSHQDAWP